MLFQLTRVFEYRIGEQLPLVLCSLLLFSPMHRMPHCIACCCYFWIRPCVLLVSFANNNANEPTTFI
jgi:hypothetical protein